MGNCTSKKSKKSLKLTAKNPILHSKMDKEQDIHSKGLSKVAPFTKGEITSFGFKKKVSSQLPVPVTLTSNGHIREPEEKTTHNGVVNANVSNEEYQSGSSVESLCHAPFRSTPKMIRKRDLVKNQNISKTDTERDVSLYKTKTSKSTFQTLSTSLALHNENNNSVNINCCNGNGKNVNFEPSVNRFGFRQPSSLRQPENLGKNLKSNGVTQVSRSSTLTGQGPYDTKTFTVKSKTEISRSRSEGPREAFFKQNLQPANSVQSVFNQSKSSLITNCQPGKFTFQTSHLPRPQFPVRMPDTKTAKTAVNYFKKGGVQSDSSSKEGSINEDSGFESHSSANNTLEKNILILDSSPGSKVRRCLPAYKGKKLEMKITGNKFELLKKDEEKPQDVVTEVSLIKLPASNSQTRTTVINTGLVEQRANQYLKKISQTYKNEIDTGFKNLKRITSKGNIAETSNPFNGDEGLGAESEEEKLFKDREKTEKNTGEFLMSEGCGDADDMLPGEAMAEDFSLCLSFDEKTMTERPKTSIRAVFQTECEVTPNTIRLDALKLSKQLKCKSDDLKEDNSCFDLLTTSGKEEEIFPTDSILEQLSSDSDSFGDKRENKNNDKEKNLKNVHMNLGKEDLGIDMDEEDNNYSKSDTDIDDNVLDLNIDEMEIKDEKNKCLGSASPESPESPGTPTHASNSLSLSDGRDFLIDDEIADQPQLCFSENYVDCNCQEHSKSHHEKTVTSPNEFVTCTDVKTQTNDNVEVENIKNIDEGIEKGESENTPKFIKEERENRKNSEGTLSPCESIASDDLMLDFESNSFDETVERYDTTNENILLENVGSFTSLNNMKELVSPKNQNGLGTVKLLRAKEENSSCNSPASPKLSKISHVVSSPLRSSRCTSADDDFIRLDKASYRNVFQDVVSMKSMLLKLKQILQKSEGSLLESGRICPEDGMIDNIMEDELTDLRRQVLFLQQQLEEREKTVQILRCEINKTPDSGREATTAESRTHSNAATQTGLDQFQQEFPHFRIFQTAPVV